MSRSAGPRRRRPVLPEGVSACMEAQMAKARLEVPPSRTISIRRKSFAKVRTSSVCNRPARIPREPLLSVKCTRHASCAFVRPCDVSATEQRTSKAPSHTACSSSSEYLQPVPSMLSTHQVLRASGLAAAASSRPEGSATSASLDWADRGGGGEVGSVAAAGDEGGVAPAVDAAKATAAVEKDTWPLVAHGRTATSSSNMRARASVRCHCSGRCPAMR